MSLMYTQSGRVIDPLNFRASDIDLVDIAHALSMICRYGGHTSRFYSVAEHCVRLGDFLLSEDSLLCQAALMHDAAEAYVGDMVHPIKSTFTIFEDEVELPVLNKISEHFDIPMAEFQMVKPFDKRISINEMKQLMPKVCDSLQGEPLPLRDVVFGWSPEQAREEFLHRADWWGVFR